MVYVSGDTAVTLVTVQRSKEPVSAMSLIVMLGSEASNCRSCAIRGAAREPRSVWTPNPTLSPTAWTGTFATPEAGGERAKDEKISSEAANDPEPNGGRGFMGLPKQTG